MIFICKILVYNQDMTYIRRNVEQKIHKLLSFFPIVFIVGPRQVGKTTLAKKCASSWEYFDLEKGKDFDYITRDIDFFFQEHKDHLINDEAQEYPQLFKELRSVVDSDRQKKRTLSAYRLKFSRPPSKCLRYISWESGHRRVRNSKNQ